MPFGIQIETDAARVEAFLRPVAIERKVNLSARNQALSALLFLYREALSIDLSRFNEIGRQHTARQFVAVAAVD